MNILNKLNARGSGFYVACGPALGQFVLNRHGTHVTVLLRNNLRSRSERVRNAFQTSSELHCEFDSKVNRKTSLISDFSQLLNGLNLII